MLNTDCSSTHQLLVVSVFALLPEAKLEEGPSSGLGSSDDVRRISITTSTTTTGGGCGGGGWFLKLFSLLRRS